MKFKIPMKVLQMNHKILLVFNKHFTSILLRRLVLFFCLSIITYVQSNFYQKLLDIGFYFYYNGLRKQICREAWFAKEWLWFARRMNLQRVNLEFEISMSFIDELRQLRSYKNWISGTRKLALPFIINHVHSFRSAASSRLVGRTIIDFDHAIVVEIRRRHVEDLRGALTILINEINGDGARASRHGGPT